MTTTTARSRWSRGAVVLGLAASLAVGLVPAAAATPAQAGSSPSRLAAKDTPSTWWYDAMGYDEIHRGGTGRGITVAVIDGPLDPDVPEIKGKVASVRTLCFDRTAATANDSRADHATNIVALIVGTGRGAGGPGVRGIAPDATLRHYSLGKDEKDICGNSLDQLSQQTLDQAVKDGARIVSISEAGSFNGPLFTAALARAQRAGVIIVAGTDDHHRTVDYPARSNGVVAVNHVDRHGKLDPYAATGPASAGKVDIAAPGTDMLMGQHSGHTWVSGRSGWSGSSFATPLVAGGLAAVWSSFPKATANQVLQMMVNTPGLKRGKDAQGKPGWFYAFRRVGSGFPGVKQSGGGFGWGIFDPADMMRRDPAQFPDVNPVLEMSNSDDVQPTWSEVTGKPLPTQGAGGASTTATPSTAPAGSPAPRANDGDSSPLPWVLGGAAALVLVAGGAVMALRRGRGGAEPTTTKTLEGSSHGASS